MKNNIIQLFGTQDTTRYDDMSVQELLDEMQKSIDELNNLIEEK